MSADETAPVAAPTRQRLAASIRDRISTGVLEPGSRLNERELCEDFDVSRTVVRETLRQIEAEGFVTIEPNRGAVVVTVSYADAEQMFELRESLESLACSLFARRGTVEHKRALWEVIERLEAAVDTGDLTAILAAKADFYDVLLLGAGNEQLTSTLRLLRVRINLLRRYSLSLPERHPETLTEIRAIRDAIVSGDVDGARRAGEHHVQQASRAALPRIFDELQRAAT
ncbi:GntR family transcriptional regulator [Gordonia liuliyuniae]|uniref:GntR family transcriptional regulator n=1 Tax=Gordonia liuliyuniae TaxID=2911517 RepID=A0ABS9IST6_9ACTN|nr:GntR family transcriptional regulator [Gordonia liuliyuniae]MCF8588603.1 GntR family transcriptional regulator [Gordonia liuliyuniae]